MVTRFVHEIYPWLSQDRLEAYRPVHGTDLDMVVNYLFNTALSEALYVPLGFLEIALRNTMHTTLAAIYQSQTWFDHPGILETYQANEVAEAKRRILKSRRAATPGRIVAELNFGFWVSLLGRNYDRRFWWPSNARNLRTAFPHIPSNLRQRKMIYNHCNALRMLRNRVMHHEPIWNRLSLAQDYQTIYDAIGWISPDIVIVVRLLDRFPNILVGGRSQIEAATKNHFGVS